MNVTTNSSETPLQAAEARLQQIQSMDLPAEARLLLEDALEQLAEAQKEKADFVSTVSHELRIPMTSIMGYTDLLINEAIGEVNQQQRDFLKVIRDNVGRMAKLVADLSDIYKAESGRLHVEVEPMALTLAVTDGLTQVRPKLNGRIHAVDVHLPENLPMVQADSKRTAQMVAYLVENAALYSPTDAPIHLHAEHDPATGQVRVLVTDEGIGVLPQDQAQLFTQFFRSEVEEVRAHKGWGLSLCVVKSLAELLNGQVGYQTEPGKGSTFWFSVPAAAG